jgi:hypothetical protein
LIIKLTQVRLKNWMLSIDSSPRAEVELKDIFKTFGLQCKFILNPVNGLVNVFAVKSKPSPLGVKMVLVDDSPRDLTGPH